MGSRSQPTVLIVDDSPLARAFVVEALGTVGFPVREAATGQEGLRRAAEQPDLIILDVNLPDLDGLEVCRRVKDDARTRAIPVLMLSGFYRDSTDRARALEGGADAYLTKPVMATELIATVRALLRMREAEKQSEERFRLLLDAAPALVMGVDASGRVALFNRVCEELSGRRAEAVLGRPVDPLLLPPAWRDLVPRALAGDVRPALTPEEHRWPASNGAQRLVEWRGFFVPAPDGRILFVQVGHDVTERARAQEVLGQRVALTALTADIASALTRGETLAETLQGCVEALVRDLGVTAARIWTLEPGGEVLELRASVGLPADDEADARVPLAKLDLASLARRWPGIDGVQGYALMVDHRVVGMLAVFAPAPLPAPTAETLGLIAGQLAQCIERRRAEDALRQRVAQARFMVEVGRAITESLDPQAVLERIVDQACLLLRADRFALAVVEPEPGEAVLRFAATRGLSEQFRERLRPRHWADGTTAMAVRRRGPVWTADILNDPAITLTPSTRAVVEAEGYRAVLSVPLLDGDGAFGALVLYRDLPGPFSQDEVEVLQVFAAQAAIALNNARLYRRSEARAEKLSALSRLGQLITSAAASGEVFRAVAEAAATLLEARLTRVWVDDPDRQVLRIQGSYGLGAEFEETLSAIRELAYDRGLTGEVFRTRTAAYVREIQEDPRWLNHRLAREAGLHACAALPLVGGAGAVGVLAIHFGDPREFGDEERELMRLLADHAAIAITQAQLYAEAERRRREAEVMAELARDMNASLDVDRVLHHVAAGAKDLCGADFARIALRAADGAMRFRHAPGTRYPHWPEVAIEPGKGSGGYVLATGQPFRTAEYEADPRITKDYLELARAEGTVAEMVVPVRSGEEIHGLLYVSNRSTRPFTDHDEATLRRLGDHAGAAIKNAALYQELRAAHERLEQSQAQLVQTERLRALGEMAAGVAHDFNNLLAVMLGRAELLLRRVTEPDVVRGLTAIRQAARDGADTVRRIQEFTRTRQTRPFGRVDVAEAVHEVIELTRPQWKDEAQSRGVQYAVGVEGTAPPIRGRSEELREVFANLLTNALEAMAAGGTCRFRVGVEGEDWVTVTVEDTGVGMSEETRRRVFEPFFTTKGPRGNGLGLAVSWGIVNRHGGSIEVRSTLGAGSSFIVRLPLAAAAPPAEAAIPALPSAVRAARILVIDDEAAVRAVLTDVLREAGYSVLEAHDGLEGLERCSHEPVDLVLTDVSMPGLSGWDVAAACRARFPDLPVGLVTGWGDQLDAHRVERSGITFVLAKPFQPDEVLRQVAQSLGPAPA